MELLKMTWPTFFVVNLYFCSEAECILNGILVRNPTRFKFVVALKFNFGTNRQLCSGAILSDNMVSTAAHCVIDNHSEFADRVTIRAHTLRSSRSNQAIERFAKRAYVPEPYMSGLFDDDIAILEVNRGFDLTENRYKLGIVSLPSNGYVIDRMDAIVAGFGANRFEDDIAQSDGMLRSLAVKIIPNAICHKRKAEASNSFVCAVVANDTQYSSEPQGICDGDSGAPLVIRNGSDFKIVGVAVESDKSCDDRTTAALYMRVSEYLTRFILKVLNDEISTDIYVQDITPRRHSCV